MYITITHSKVWNKKKDFDLKNQNAINLFEFFDDMSTVYEKNLTNCFNANKIYYNV